jgi:cytochrome c peroxidase
VVAAPGSEARACSDPIDAPAEVQVGDRLFRETRFAQFFFNFITAAPRRDVNTRLVHGDPVVNNEQNAAGKPLRDPFRNQSMNCRNCHLGDDLLGASKLEGRTYCDFARRSPMPARSDGRTTTARNSPLLVSVSTPREVPELLHFDGEFAGLEELTIATLTGRNFGWLPSEFDQAKAHIISVIKNDNGKNALARRYGCGGFPYRVVLKGADPRLPKGLVLPAQYRIDVATATDDEILQAIGALIHAYMDSIAFNLNEPPSPYDVFLTKNGLPGAPNQGESNLAYARRLLGLINQLGNPKFVTPKDGSFKLHKQKFQFGAAELRGLKVFFTQPFAPSSNSAGNCIACHTPPAFTDNIFHNTGVSQLEYDAALGAGQFASLTIPNLTTRDADFDAYLPPTPNHPNASGMFRSPASSDNPGFTDLGVWNIFANPDIPNPQTALTQILCAEFSDVACTPDAILARTLAFFKTPSVRDPGQSNPYMHNGSLDTIGQVLTFYGTVSDLARRPGQLRNASPELSNVFINADDVPSLTAFLNALNEDYR